MSAEITPVDPKKKLKEIRGKVLYGWNIAVKNAKLYSPQHPSTAQAIQGLIAALSDVFQISGELSIHQTEGLFRIEEDVFLEESLLMFELLSVLEESKISRVLFLPGIQADEILSFVMTLQKKPGAPVTPQPLFASAHLKAFPEAPEANKISEKQRTFERILSTQKIIRDWSDRTAAIFNRLIDEQTLLVAELSEPFDELIDALQRNPSLFSIGLSLPKKHNLHLEHAVHTMILSLYIGQQIGYDMSTLKNLALAALCHDIGRNFLPTDFSSGQILEPSDIELIKLHARDGASFLSGVQSLPLLIARVALEHHVGYDGLGYPHLPKGLKPHVFSQIVGLADFVSWGSISEKSYHRPTSSAKLVRCLLHRAGTQFNPIMVKLLLPFMGLYPTGTKVILDTGEKAICLENNYRNILRPALAINGQTYRWISDVAATGKPFSCEIKNFRGQELNMEPLLPLIPNLQQTPS